MVLCYLFSRKKPDIPYLKETKDITRLIHALGYRDLDVQWRAAEALTEVGRDHMEVLLGALRTRNKDIILGIIEVLGEMGDPRGVDELLPFLQEKSNEIRLQAALALGKIGEKNSAKPLATLLRDPDKYVRYGAALALETMAWKPEEDTEKALLALGKQDWEKVTLLGESALPALSVALQDRDVRVRERAVDLLGSIGGVKVITGIYRSLRDEDDQVRWKAVLAAPRCGISLHYIPRGLRKRPQKRKNPVAAAILNFLLPGMGYTYLGKWWGLLIFQADVTLTIFVFAFSEMITYVLLFPVYALLAIHAAILAKRIPELQ
jgi:hypothetical protein